MRRAFTLIELLVIIAIMGTMVSVGIVSFTSGRASTSVFAAVRDVMAVARRARATALVTQEPVVVIYSNGKSDDGEDACAKVEIKAKKFFSSKKSEKPVETLNGDIVSEDGELIDPFRAATDRKEKTTPAQTLGEDGKPVAAEEEGETIEDVLAPTRISQEVLKGLKIKVLEKDETFVLPESETRKSKISIFSTAGAVARSYEAKETPSGPQTAAPAEMGIELESEAPKEIVFNVNGTVNPPHRIWIYPDGSSPEKGLCIEVDRYGEPKCTDVEGM